MRLTICFIAFVLLGACGNEARGPMTFSCASSGEESGNPSQTVLFHLAEGYLFLQNDEGAAENVCSKQGTVDCSVTVTKKAITLNQSVEEPYCGFRTTAKTVLDINRETGAFKLLQEGCDPQDDFVVTGQCGALSLTETE